MENKLSISKLERAKSRVEKLKSFYNHLIVFFVVNIVITGFKVSDHLYSWDAFANDFFNWGTLSNWLVWGVILAIHGFAVFVFPTLFGYDWEERKIEQLMKEEFESNK